MGRFTDREETERYGEEQSQSRMPLSQGRGGSNSSNESEYERLARSSGDFSPNFERQIRSVIEQASAGQPTMSEFVQRLEAQGVNAIPSLQSSGRLNGMVYRFEGRNIKGSELGREFTAQGLMQQKGVSYDAERDRATLLRAAESAGLHRADATLRDRETDNGSPRDRTSRRRDRETDLSADQKTALAEIGKFRTVNTSDLIRYQYGGDSARFRQDMRQLSERGLVQQRFVDQSKTGARYSVVVLTARGRKTASKLVAPRGNGKQEQQFHSGLVKPAEVRHDAGVYRMYQAEAERIGRDGGTVTRVVLDYELKRKVFSALNKEQGASALRHASRKEQIASENGLKVVEGRVVFPDLRIEYDTRNGEPDKVDLELATGDYKNAEVAMKHAAGLKIYGPDSAPRSPALQDPGIVAGLISF